jgi:hypothetical protein
MIAWRTFAVGLLCALPFAILNTLVATPVPAFVAWLRPNGHTSGFELILLWSAIVAVMGGGVVALSALWQQRRFVVLNGILGAGLLIAGVVLVLTVGAEMLACEWQRVPNCD